MIIRIICSINGRTIENCFEGDVITFSGVIKVRRPMFTDSVRSDGCYNTGSITFAWFVWLRILEGIPDPIIKWIDNNEYVISVNKKVIEKQRILF